MCNAESTTYKGENKLKIEQMQTETRNLETMNLDMMTPIEIVTAMNREDQKVPLIIEALLPQIAEVVIIVEDTLRKGKRLFYVGAGTSGRLGVLDASECPPTFGVSDTMVVGVIAGGEGALRHPIENAEDNPESGKNDLQEHFLKKEDVVIGIAASGRTPYVIGALEYAKSIGCHTVAISCNHGSDIGKIAEISIEAEVGPEVLTGSTRLKAGTAQKLILNMITTASMVRMGKVYQNLMVDMVQSNEKLCERAERIVMEATEVSREEARKAIDTAGGNVKTAVTMILAKCDADTARHLLDKSHGHIRKAITQSR